MNAVPVVFATDNNYAPYCGVAISSLIDCASDATTYEIFVLHSKLKDIYIERLEQLSTDYIIVKCVDTSIYVEKINATDTNGSTYLTATSAYRVMISQMFSQFDKVLYLDCDIIIKFDVKELYEFDIENKLLGAALGYINEKITNKMFQYVTETLGISCDQYFNAGILLINISEWLKEDVSDKCLKLLMSNQKYTFFDQDVLNLVCMGRVHYFPIEWNYETLYKTSNAIHTNKQRQNARQIENPKIIHYTSIRKPWADETVPFGNEFWECANRSQFADIIHYKRNTILAAYTNAPMFPLPFKKIKPDSNVVLYGGGMVGKAYYHQIKAVPYCKIVMWSDKNYKALNCDEYFLFTYEHELQPPESISEIEYDYVLIAIENWTEEDEASFIKLGIDPAKIIRA